VVAGNGQAGTAFGPIRMIGSRCKGGVEMELPKCQKCDNGTLIPLSDYGQDGASVMYKAWVCINPDCGFSLRIDKGEVSYGRKIDLKR
jgi:hypothetical protein